MMPHTRSRLLAVLLLSASPALYAADELDDLLSLSLEDLTKLKVTSSTLSEETLRSVPSAMTVYSRTEIRRLGLTDLAQLAALIPGFQVARIDAWGIGNSITNRGRPIGDSNRSILILLDGQRLNSDVTGASSLYDSKILLDNVERVEFIRGPGSSLYGTNAMFGVINIITRSERELRAELGSSGTRGSSAQWRHDREQGKFELFVHALNSRGQSQDIFNPSAPASQVKTYDPYASRDLSLRASIGEFTLSAREARRSAEQFYIYGYVSNSTNQRQSTSSNLKLDWQHRLKNSLVLQSKLWQSRRTLQLTTHVGLPLTGDLDEHELGTQWLLQQDKGPRRWLLGWEWRQPRTTQNSNNFGSTGPENARRINGFFGQYQSELVKDLALTTGLRYDNYSDFGGQLSPRAGLVWQALPRDTFKLLYSEAFRAPSRAETNTNSSGFISGGSYQLKPETTQTAELIWQHQHNQGLFSATLFNNRVRNSITETVSPTLQRTWINSQTRYKGLELEASYQWQRWQSRLAATRLFKVEDPAATQSSTLLAGTLSYGTGRWSLALIGSYHSQMTDPNEQNGDIRSTEYSRFGGATLWGLHLNWQLGHKLEYYLHGENIFDKKVLYPADRPENHAGVPEKGRLLTTGLRWSFD